MLAYKNNYEIDPCKQHIVSIPRGDSSSSGVVHIMINEEYLAASFGEAFAKVYATRFDANSKVSVNNSYLHRDVYPIMVFPNFLPLEYALRLKEHLLNTIPYRQKSSDLFDFYQTGDLKQFDRDEIIADICKSLFEPRWVSNMARIIDRPLDPSNIDISSQCYRKGNYLLCHDDRLEGRRVAFVYYLVDEEWSAERDGGRLEFFSCDWRGRPSNQKAGITPQFNTLVAFEVSMFSHHEVCEVLGDRPRLSVAGWLHDGDISLESNVISGLPTVWHNVFPEIPVIPPLSANQHLEVLHGKLVSFGAPWLPHEPWISAFLSKQFGRRIHTSLDWQTRPQLFSLPQGTNFNLPDPEEGDRRLHVIYCISGSVLIEGINLKTNQMIAAEMHSLRGEESALLIHTSFQLK